MMRTFHSKTGIVAALFRLLPATVLTVCFFWVKMPLAALVFLLLLVVLIERMLHTCYVLDDDGMLWILKGRLSRRVRLKLSDIERVEVVRTSSLSVFKSRKAVMLSMRDGSLRFITPVPAEDFCRCLNQKKKNMQ